MQFKGRQNVVDYFICLNVVDNLQLKTYKFHGALLFICTKFNLVDPRAFDQQSNFTIARIEIDHPLLLVLSIYLYLFGKPIT